jgi:riboflavin synthase
MFTGIIQAVGSIIQLERRGDDARLLVDATALPMGDVGVGDSIAVSGVCLTVVALDGATFAADLSGETLARTSLGRLRAGAAVNLEKALRLSDRLGGHLVSGHVDAIGEVLAIDPLERAQRWRFRLPAALTRYVAEKGSICIDGASLTVNGADDDSFHVALIPHTIAVTTFRDRRVGDAVNLEVDLVARYLERLTANRTG